MDVMKQVLTGDRKTKWNKLEGSLVVLSKWGANLVASQDGEVWRRHRRVVGPAFDGTLYQLVWTKTLETYAEMEAAEGWSNCDVVDLPAVQAISTKMALLVIAKCGFGLSVDWSAPPIGPDGEITVQEAVRVLADSYIVGMMMPNWVQYLPLPGFAEIRRAFQAFTGFMQHEIASRTEEVRSGSQLADDRKDTFTMIVRANEQESGKLKLSDQEVIGNVFIMLFAGHETTAHTLSATLALLALHQEIQNEICEHIISVIGHDRDPVFSDYESLDKVLATFYEALRLFRKSFVRLYGSQADVSGNPASAYIMIRQATEDTVLNLPNPIGQDGNTPLAVHKGTVIGLDLIGMHYNPRYFPDPENFRPSRWYGTSGDSEAFFAFSIGPRACIGRKFATVEAVAFLTMLLRDWRVEPTFKDNETPEAWRERVLSLPNMGLTLGVRGAPVKLTRRQARS
ncbi:hypothetical protein C0991_000812 [Blastosporella zonata]|nr:hypothetical protein C0991_000812 [Blastosporella zonata]